MSLSEARGRSEGRNSNQSTGRSTSPFWNEGRSWRNPGFEIGDFVNYVGPSYTFPGTDVTMRQGMEGEVVGHGVNVPEEYQTHLFLSVRFFGHANATNVPLEALATGFRAPGSLSAGTPPTSLDGVPDFLDCTHERNGGGECLDCCAGPRTIPRRVGRPERGTCDVRTFFVALFGDDAREKPPERYTW